MLTNDQKQQFSDILEELGKTLDISETQYEAAVKSYEAVGTWLAKEDWVQWLNQSTIKMIWILTLYAN
jgi:trans-aconitate methyltransferase